MDCYFDEIADVHLHDNIHNKAFSTEIEIGNDKN